jgi:hypothetical protein
MSDRNRANFDWKSGSFTWHYRNRLSTKSGAQQTSTQLVSFLQADTPNLMPTMSMRTIPARAHTNSKMTLASPSTYIFPSKRNEYGKLSNAATNQGNVALIAVEACIRAMRGIRFRM